MAITTINRTTRDLQIRLNSLGFLQEYGKPFLAVDGLKGRNTRSALELAMKHFDANSIEELFDPSGINRIHWHWSGGAYGDIASAFPHYNDLHDHEGNSYDGAAPAQQQAFYQPRRVGVSHTLNANTGAIGQALIAMGTATESRGKVDMGKYPLTWDGIDAMLERSAEYCRIFDIKVSPWTTLSHAEVQPNLGIRQNHKWDIRVLPDDPQKLLDARVAGNILRDRLRKML